MVEKLDKICAKINNYEFSTIPIVRKNFCNMGEVAPNI